MPEPELSEDITAGGLDAEVRRDLRGLQRDTAESVARHLVAAGRLVDEDPALALEHARFARARASRIAVVREAAGIAAYHAGEWAEALGELRAARRMGGGPGHLAVMADIERALGRPERAIELSRGPEVRELDRAESIELAIVAAGARRDLGEVDASVVNLQIPELDPERRDPWSARLFYAYADNLLAAGRESDALQWFVHAADADEAGETDADRRIAELTGEPLPEDDYAFGEDDAAEGDAAEGDAAEGDAAEGDAAEGDADPGDDEPEDLGGPDARSAERAGDAGAEIGVGSEDTARETGPADRVDAGPEAVDTVTGEPVDADAGPDDGPVAAAAAGEPRAAERAESEVADAVAGGPGGGTVGAEPRAGEPAASDTAAGGSSEAGDVPADAEAERLGVAPDAAAGSDGESAVAGDAPATAAAGRDARSAERADGPADGRSADRVADADAADPAADDERGR